MQMGITLETPACRHRSGFGGAPAQATGGGDVTPPGTITDFFLVTSNGTDDALFAAPAVPPDFPTGSPAFYEIRRRAGLQITSDVAWNAAEQVSGGWQAESSGDGDYAEYYLVGLSTGSHWYHIRWKDAAGNVGAISNGVAITLV